MFRALIIDDEQHCIDRLSQLLDDQNQIINSYLCCNTVPEAKKILEIHKIDVVFLDVQLQHESGFKLLKELASKITFEIIFTTAHNKYAVEAFKFSALDYLLKPIDENDLKRALIKLKEKQTLLDTAKKVETLLYNLDENNSNKLITISTSEGAHIIKINEIIRCEADSNYTHIHLTSNKNIIASKTLKHFENLLEQFPFFRVHQSHLINLLHLKKFHLQKRKVILSDASEIKVSVRKKEALHSIIKDGFSF